MLSKNSSCHSSSAALSRDHIEHDHWADRSKISGFMSFQSKMFPHESDADEIKAKKKEDHAVVKYIKLEVRFFFKRTNHLI